MEATGQDSKVTICEDKEVVFCTLKQEYTCEKSATFLYITGNINTLNSNPIEDLCCLRHSYSVIQIPIKIEFNFDLSGKAAREETALYQLIRFSRNFEVGHVQNWKAEFKMLVGDYSQFCSKRQEKSKNDQ